MIQYIEEKLESLRILKKLGGVKLILLEKYLIFQTLMIFYPMQHFVYLHHDETWLLCFIDMDTPQSP